MVLYSFQFSRVYINSDFFPTVEYLQKGKLNGDNDEPSNSSNFGHPSFKQTHIIGAENSLRLGRRTTFRFQNHIWSFRMEFNARYQKGP